MKLTRKLAALALTFGTLGGTAAAVAPALMATAPAAVAASPAAHAKANHIYGD